MKYYRLILDWCIYSVFVLLIGSFMVFITKNLLKREIKFHSNMLFRMVYFHSVNTCFRSNFFKTKTDANSLLAFSLANQFLWFRFIPENVHAE